jgi:hypothetical protein
MKRFMLLLFLPAMLSLPSMAQEIGRVQQNLNTTDIRTGNLLLTFNESYYGIEGTPYHNIDFLPGAFFQAGAGRHEDILLRYNAYEDWPEMLSEGDSLVLNPAVVRYFEVQEKGNLITYKNGFTNGREGIERQNFLQVLHEGNITLLKRHTKKLTPANFDAVFRTGSKYDRFEDQQKYFILLDNGIDIEPLRLRKKDVLERMDRKSDVVEKYARDNRLNFRSETDVVKMMQYAERE